MSNQIELTAEERIISGKRQLRELREQGGIPATMYGPGQPSVTLQVKGIALEKLVGHRGQTVMLTLKVDGQPGVQALIKQVQHNPRSGVITHVDFYRLTATEKLKTHVLFHFVNEPTVVSMSELTILRPLNEVMVECLPADLPSSIEVDLSQLNEMGAVIRVGDLTVGDGVTILTDHNEMVAGLHQKAAAEKADVTEEKAEAAPAAPTA
jgi:large subunit ribosomal protein L25